MKKRGHYTPKFEIKDINILVDGNNFFDVSVKNKEEPYKKLLRSVRIMITQLVIHWTVSIFQSINN